MAAMAAKLIGVGVGPGDPDLLTTRAVRTLRAADRVVAPSVAVDAVGRAESVVRQAVPDVRIERLVFDMSGEHSYTDSAAALLPWLDDGEVVAFVTLGDPNVYSTFSSLAAAVVAQRPGLAVETVPGIMAFQDLAARSGTVVLDGSESLALVTALDGAGAVAEAAADPARAVVVYKGGRHLPAVAKALADAGRLDGAVVGELLGLPGQRVGPVAEAADQPATYLATVIVPPANRPPIFSTAPAAVEKMGEGPGGST
ncbi:MAG: precorrin-2/cobalt-factor-2 C20-methyltransferase [Acidimicrobiaceae bacterium]|nr:precorrin-2/cobalt-factor-2 C20-methyltransferase [Acidimicrobiaceae bacterium]